MKRSAILLTTSIILSVFWSCFLAYSLFSSTEELISTGIHLALAIVITIVLIGIWLTIKSKTTIYVWLLGATTAIVGCIQFLWPELILSLWNITLAILALFIGFVLMQINGNTKTQKSIILGPAVLTSFLFLFKLELEFIFITGTILCILAAVISAMTLILKRD